MSAGFLNYVVTDKKRAARLFSFRLLTFTPRATKSFQKNY
jgi:hypothetical protein